MRAWCFGFMLLLIAVSDVRGETIVEFTFADENATKATNTGTLGAGTNGAINGGSIVDSPLSPDGKGLLLGGSNGNGISMPNTFDFDDAFTISVLARLESYQNQQSIIFDDFGAPGVLLSVNTSTQQLRLRLNTENDVVTLLSPGPFSLSEWQRVDAVYNGSKVFLLIDGNVVDSASATGAVVNNELVTPNVGVESDDVEFPWDGALDDFAISTVALPVPESGAWLTSGIAAALFAVVRGRIGSRSTKG